MFRCSGGGERRRPRGAVGALAALALLAPAAARAEAPLVQQLTKWLDEPGVRVVAVEVYSETCKPCMEAVPRWEALRKKYASRGLRLVVINIDDYDSDTQCKKLPWRPDLLKCSPELAEQLGVQSVPQAFVWSWQGPNEVPGEDRRPQEGRPPKVAPATSRPRLTRRSPTPAWP